VDKASVNSGPQHERWMLGTRKLTFVVVFIFVIFVFVSKV
jgi:hypothetical protein